MTPDTQTGRYRALLETARRFGSAMDLNGLVDEILKRAQEVMAAEACSILLPDEVSGDLILLSTADEIRSLQQAPRIPAGQGIAGEAYRKRQVINVKDAQTDPRHYHGIEAQVNSVTHAMLTIPLREGDRCLGVMQALNPIGRDRFDAESEELFLGFGGLIVNALLRLEAQRREVERARNRQELGLAREIQESFLPPPLQRLPFCRVHLRSLPARLVGGDFCFLHRVGDYRLLAGLGDVSGKGIPAALTMARATAMIKVMSGRIGDDLAAWVGELNRQVCEDLKAGRFIGMTVLLADARANTLQICSAGEYAPLRLTEGEWRETEPAMQLPLGVLPEFVYEAHTLELQPGEFWLLYSDGITEVRNPNGEELGESGFIRRLPRHLPADETVGQAVGAWTDHMGSASQHDDASMLLLDWRGLPPPTEHQGQCCPENLCACRRFVERWAQYCGFDYVKVGQIMTACDEAASNIFKHAYGGESGPVRIKASQTADALRFEIQDQAPPVAREKIKGRDLNDLRPGGLGTVILNAVFDTVEYEPLPDGNRLRLSLSLPD